MSDIRFPGDVAPVSRVPASSPITARIVQAAEALNLANGQTLQGEVMGRNRAGQLEVLTKLGLIQIDAQQAIATGKTISITIQQSGLSPQVLLQVLHQSEDKKIKQAGGPDTPKTEPLPQSQAAKPIPVNQVIGQRLAASFIEIVGEQKPIPRPGADAILTGKVIAQPNGTLAVETEFGAIDIPDPPPSLKPGSQAQIEIFKDGKPPRLLPQPAPSPSNAPNPSASPLLQAQAESAKPGPAPQPQAYGQTYGHTMAPIRPQPQAIQATIISNAGENPAPPSAQAVKAQVLYVSPQNGQPTLRTAQGLMTMGLPLAVSVGEEFWIESTLPPQPAATAKSTITNAPSAPPGFSAPALQESLDELQKTMPHLTQTILQNMIPNAQGDKFVQAMILYLTAFSGGEAKFLIGMKAAKELSKSKPDLLEKLESGFNAMRQTDETTSHAWRHMPLPIFDGRQLQYAQFYFKNHGDEADEQNRGQRFMIEADLSNLGALQLDGFVRNDHFDLVLRSKREIPDNVAQDIRTIFLDYMELSGWQGRITFQQAAEFPIHPSAESTMASHIQQKI